MIYPPKLPFDRPNEGGWIMLRAGKDQWDIPDWRKKDYLNIGDIVWFDHCQSMTFQIESRIMDGIYYPIHWEYAEVVDKNHPEVKAYEDGLMSNMGDW